MLYSPKLDRLLRIMIVPESMCNYQCVFCCFWNETYKKQKFFLLGPSDYQFIVETLIQSNCERVMLTGGEPLLVPRKKLLDIVFSITQVKGLHGFWITTNGSLLTKTLCKELKESGLNEIVVSIAAENDYKYKKCTKSNVDLLHILENIKAALDIGIDVSAHVPLNKVGIKNYNELMKLIFQLESIGVKKIAYFHLHKTKENASVYDRLYVSPYLITKQFHNSSNWNLIKTKRGQYIFSNKKTSVLIPTKIQLETENCKHNKCGKYCQGNYAAYLIAHKDRTFIRACHRNFIDQRNEFDIPQSIIKKRDKNKLLNIYKNIWRYSYE